MKLIILSTDPTILREGSGAYMRTKEYEKLFDELHVVLVTGIFSLVTSFFICARIAKKAPKSFLVSSQEEFTGLIAALLRWALGVRWQAQIHTDVFGPYYTRVFFKNKLRRLVARATLGQASCIRAVSRRIQKSLVAQGFSAPVDILPITPDFERFRTIALPSQSDECVALIISRLTREKNVLGAVRAFAAAYKKVSALRLRIAGEGPERAATEREAARLGVASAVSFVGFQQDIRSELEGADLVFLFSWYEGFGMAAAEAMAAGRAVVMSDVGIAGELLVHEVSGIVVGPGDEVAAGNALIKLAQDRALRERLGEEARKSIALLGDVDYYKKFQTICESCMQ